MRIGSVGGFRCAEEEAIYRADIERRAAALRADARALAGPVPRRHRVGDARRDVRRSRPAASSRTRWRRSGRRSPRAATSASATGCSSRPAAAEMHPAAVIKSAELRGTRRRLEEATEAARAAGVRDVPAVRVGDAVFHGDGELERGPRAGGDLKANREYELIVRRGGAARPRSPIRSASTRSRSSRSRPARSRCSGTPRRRRRAADARAEDRPRAARGRRLHPPLASLGAGLKDPGHVPNK